MWRPDTWSLRRPLANGIQILIHFHGTQQILGSDRTPLEEAEEMNSGDSHREGMQPEARKEGHERWTATLRVESPADVPMGLGRKSILSEQRNSNKVSPPVSCR